MQNMQNMLTEEPSEVLPASVFGETDHLKCVPLDSLEIANI